MRVFKQPTMRRNLVTFFSAYTYLLYVLCIENISMEVLEVCDGENRRILA